MTSVLGSAAFGSLGGHGRPTAPMLPRQRRHQPTRRAGPVGRAGPALLLTWLGRQ
jgi:hypothetical protein